MPYSSNDINKNYDIARQWAEQQAKSEAESFEKAIKRLKPEDRIQQLEEENAELRRQNISQREQILKLREALRRGQEDYYE